MSKKHKYIVEVSRSTHSRIRLFQVEATSKDKAETLAFDGAAEVEFLDDHLAYTIESCTRID
jgi:hypothetical protein